MTNPDARPEPIHVAEFEGEYVRVMVGSLPSLSLEMDAGYQRGTHLKLGLEVRIRNVKYEEITAKEHRGELKRVHTFAIEEAQILDAMTAEQADAGVGGSAGGGKLRIEERFEMEGGLARECWYDNVRMEVVHRGGCELCQTVSDEVLDFLATGTDPGF